jgi:uncharacterized protein YbjT (DUF2867 family)
MVQKLTVVVTGGTGKQGGAVVKSLRERGHEVRVVTRNPDSAKARELASAGVALVRASLEDTAALTKALEGATSLFAMTTPFEAGTQGEIRQGVSAADAAKAADVHLVFTSVGSANRQTGVPHFDSKYEIEKHIARIGIRATVLAPVYFMDNLYFGKEQLAKGIYASPLPPTRQLAQVAASISEATSSRATMCSPPSRVSPVARSPISGSRWTSSASGWARTASGCTSGSTAPASRSIAQRFDVSFPMSPFTTSSRGRRFKIGTRFFKARRAPTPLHSASHE